MAAGTRKRRIIRVTFSGGTGSPVVATGEWDLDVEDSIGQDHTDGHGTVTADLGPWSTAKNLTLLDVRTTLLTLVSAIPGHDTVS
jgi:hypothetical protein